MSRAVVHGPAIVVVVASLVLMLTRPRGIAEVWWVGAGAVVLVAVRLVTVGVAVKAVGQGTDAYAFLAGMMLLSELARTHGVRARADAWRLRLALVMHDRLGRRVRLFTIVYGIAIVVTTFLSNDATAVVLTPAILAAVRKAKVDPLPHLYVCALVANAASFVLPISNPANLVVFDGAMPSLGHWLAAFAVPSLLSIAVIYGALRLVFRRELRSRSRPQRSGCRFAGAATACSLVSGSSRRCFSSPYWDGSISGSRRSRRRCSSSWSPRSQRGEALSGSRGT